MTTAWMTVANNNVNSLLVSNTERITSLRPYLPVSHDTLKCTTDRNDSNEQIQSVLRRYSNSIESIRTRPS